MLSMPANPILHRMLTDPYLYKFVASIVAPLLLWTVLVRFARSHPDILQGMYSPLKIFTWALWFCTVATGFYVVVGLSSLKTFARTQILIANFSGGVNLIYMWVKRRVDPDSFKKHEGWRPNSLGPAISGEADGSKITSPPK